MATSDRQKLIQQFMKKNARNANTARSYVSQGKAVEKVANVQNRRSAQVLAGRRYSANQAQAEKEWSEQYWRHKLGISKTPAPKQGY
jgi:hypothetical protein